MPVCSFAEGAAMFDATPIENMFLLEYLPIAPDEYLKVYLYARLLALHPELGAGIEDIERALRMDQEAIEDAFRYWEREGLVERLSDKPPTYRLRPMRGDQVLSDMDRSYYEFSDYINQLQALLTPDLMHPQEFTTVQEWIKDLGFTQEAAVRMVEYQLSRSKATKGKRNVRSFIRKVDKIAQEWAFRGIHTLEDVERAIAHDEGSYQMALKVVRRFSLRRQPTADEIAVADKWLNEWQLSEEEVINACAETNKTSNPSFAYLDAVLASRRSGQSDTREGLKRVLAELGVRAPITPAWQQSYDAMLASGFAPKTIELAAVQLAAKNRHRFEDLEWMVGRWGELGVRTPEAAEAYIHKSTALMHELRALYDLAGAERRIGRADLEDYEAWTRDLPAETLTYAAEQARGKRDPVGYLRATVDAWRQAGVTSLEEAKTLSARRTEGAKPAQEAVPTALNYAQRTETVPDDDIFFDVFQDQGGNEA